MAVHFTVHSISPTQVSLTAPSENMSQLDAYLVSRGFEWSSETGLIVVNGSWQNVFNALCHYSVKPSVR